MRTALPIVGLVLLCSLGFLGPLAGAGYAQPAPENALKESPAGETPAGADWYTQLESLQRAAVRLPIAAGLSTILAYRPRRRGTPARQLQVIQTQIILAIVGAIVMLVVGASLARAFGIVGAAGLIRYRAKVDDPKDAGVMLSTLALGLASGVGLYFLAGFATLFVLGTLWILESLEPEPTVMFAMSVNAKGSPALKSSIEGLLRQRHLAFELRSESADDITYDVHVPARKDTDAIAKAIATIDPKKPVEVKWEKKKEK